MATTEPKPNNHGISYDDGHVNTGLQIFHTSPSFRDIPVEQAFVGGFDFQGPTACRMHVFGFVKERLGLIVHVVRIWNCLDLFEESSTMC